MNLFVDSNIFLDFYHFSSDDLDELNKLVELIKKGKIDLIITEQVINEVSRNRDNKVADAYNQFHDSKIDLKIPQICKSYPEFKKILTLQNDLKKLKVDLDKKLMTDISNRSLQADQIIDLLFKIAKTIETSEFIKLAKQRYNLGNPPGKNNSYGDALNWEALIASLPQKKDLFFISDDKDYKSPLDEKTFNSFLLKEWCENKKSRLYFYTRLSDFFNEHHQDIRLRVEEEKNSFIQYLFKSGSFAMTHALIAKLSQFNSFTDDQVKQIIDAANTNGQVHSILSDPDVKEFYSSLIKNREDIIKETDLESLRKGLSQGEDSPEDNNEQITPDDIPF